MLIWSKRLTTRKKVVQNRLTCRYTIAVIALLLLLCVVEKCYWKSRTNTGTFLQSVPFPVNDSKRGAIVMLAKGGKKRSEYNEMIRRNLSVRKYCWLKNRTDVIIFHEGNINLVDQEFISSYSPDMPISFVNISDIFSKYKSVNKLECPPTKQSRKFSKGYHSMCYFWFISFRDYLGDYDWLFRFDADCELKAPSYHAIPPPEDIKFSSSIWLDLRTEKFDMISPVLPDGEVVKGMKKFVNKFASEHNINSKGYSTWRAPYTNVMYLNLTWLRSQNTINQFMDSVDQSECIYSNRWGDSPLWGAAITLANQPFHSLPVRYFHGSHHVLVDEEGNVIPKSRFYFIRWISSFFE